MKQWLFLSLAVNLFLLLGILLMSHVGFLSQAAADCIDEPCDKPPCCNGDVNGDGAMDLADAVALLSHLYASGPAPETIEGNAAGGGHPLLVTKQTFCYDLAGNVVDCRSQEFPGQDGFYRKGLVMADRFVDNGDGTVTDRYTGLTWQQLPAPNGLTWDEALRYCEDLELGGETDWRLPNVRELRSLVDYGRSQPSIDPVFLSPSAYFWSSTTIDSEAIRAWVVGFKFGIIYNGDKGNQSQSYVRAVRG